VSLLQREAGACDGSTVGGAGAAACALPAVDALRVGPFITATLASYTVHVGDQTVTLPTLGSQTAPVAPVDNGPHALFMLGARLSFF
jgi:hypothetical protein